MNYGNGYGQPPAAFYGNLSPSTLLGLNAANGSKAAGHALPPTSVMGGDHALVPWHPDSPVFWLAVIAGATVLGITGASVQVRAFKRRASVNVGDS